MSRDDRIRRPTPERTGPLRSWSTLFDPGARGAAPSPGESSTDGDVGAGALGADVVSRSVELGYRVIDEYIRQGQRMARGLSDGGSGTRGIPDLQDVTLRMSRYAAEFMGMWFELAQLAARGVGGQAPAARAPVAEPSSPAPNGRATAGERVTLQIASLRPVEVSLDLAPHATGRALVVHSLRAVDPEKPRIEHVTLEAADGVPPMLRLRVPPDQPEGIYSAVIVDEGSSRPVGTLSVRVMAE